MNFGRRIVTLLLLVLALPIIAACGGNTTNSTQTTPVTGNTTANTAAPATAATADTGTGGASATTPAASTSGSSSGTTGGPDLSKIQVEEGATLMVNTWGDASEQKVNQDSFDRFTAMFPGVTITYQPTPSDFQTKMKADAAGGTMADVFYLDSSLMTAFAPNGILLDLTSYMESAGVSKDDYVGTLSDLYVQDGKVYGLPKDFGALALFVNNDLAQAAGVDPASIKTWDDWKNAATKMSTGEGQARVYGQCSVADIERVGALMLQKGVQPVTDNKASITDPKAVEAVEFFYGMLTDKTAALPGDIGAGWCGEAFGKGQVAMALEGGWMVSFLEKDYASVNYTAIPIPQPADGKQASLVFTNAWAAKADTQFPNAAAALVLFLTSAQNQKPIMETGFALPTVKSLLSDPYFEANPNAKVVAEAGDYGTPSDFSFGPPAKMADVRKPMNSALERIWLGQGDVTSNLEQAAQEADQVLSQ